MELPDDVLKIIKEFSQPLTRPDWRTLHKMTFDKFYKNLLPYNLVRYKVDEGVMHLVYMRNIHMQVLVRNKEMSIVVMERVFWP
jgi:hypothetical protein